VPESNGEPLVDEQPKTHIASSEMVKQTTHRSHRAFGLESVWLISEILYTTGDARMPSMNHFCTSTKSSAKHWESQAISPEAAHP
jgi:hypothetical protein